MRERLHAVDSYPSHIHRKVFKELPDVVGGVDLFHLHFCVHIAMIDKVYIGHLHLGWTQIQMKTQASYDGEGKALSQYLSDAVLVGYHSDHILQWQQRGTFDLSVDVFALSTGGQQLHQRDVISEQGRQKSMNDVRDFTA